MPQDSPQQHPRFPPAPAPGFLLAAQRTESTFEEIPVIWNTILPKKSAFHLNVPEADLERPGWRPRGHGAWQELHHVSDFKNATSQDPRARRELADLIRDASINVGFFYLKDHGIPQELIEGAVNAGKDFFSLPEVEKMKLDIHKSSNFKGYTPLLGENTNAQGLGDLHEGFDLGWEPEIEPDESSSRSTSATVVRDDGVMTGGNVWPDSDALPEFKAAVLAYYHSALKLGKLLFPLFALALGLPETFFDDKTLKPAAIMRLLHYPPQSPTNLNPQDNRQIGIGSHTDYECFTILWQDSAGGLQVRNASGKWIDAAPIPGTVVVNLGDQLARWTNDVFKSTVHHVINHSGVKRYSIPLFFGSDYDVLLEPIPTCVSPGTPAKYPVITAGEFVKSRLEATYAHSAS